MRYSQSEKMEIIRLVERSALGVKRTLAEFGLSRSTFYRWYSRYVEDGYDGLANRSGHDRRFWNRIPDEERRRVVEIALASPELSPREVAFKVTDTEGWFISESSVYRILKSYDLITSPAYRVLSAADEFRHKTQRVHELWQTDFTYFKILGWGWYYLSTVLDDYSRYIIAWRLTTAKGSDDVTETLDDALARAGLEQATVRHRPRLLSDNGPCYVSRSLGEYLADKDMIHTRGAPYHPQTQGKIERYHRTLKNVVRLRNYYLPWELEQEIGRFVEYYNHERVHESLDNVTPADVYHDRHQEILTARQRLKVQTLRRRACYNRGEALREEDLISPSSIRECVR